MVDQPLMAPSVAGPSLSVLGRRDMLREEKAEENEKAKGGGEEEGMYPSLHLFLSSERYGKEETKKIKAICGNTTRPGSARDAQEYRREEMGRQTAGETDTTRLRASTPGCWRQSPQGSVPEHGTRPYLNPLSREMHLASCWQRFISGTQ